jgi:hypothetical protein
MTIRLKVVDQGHLRTPRLAEHIDERSRKLEHF